MSAHIDYSIKLLDLSMDHALKRQCLDEKSPLYGYQPVPMKGYWGGENGTGIARAFLLAYYCEGSKYYKDPQMLLRCRLAAEYTLRQQKDDGTFDLKETNLHDGAQVSFMVTTLAPAVLLMRRASSHTPEEDSLYALLMHLIDRCADGMVNGGFHTPNHRWVMSSALCMCRELTGRSDCEEKMRLLLNEGIDQDADGEFTEHSGGVYNMVCDRALLILAFVGGMTELYDRVAANLRMVFKYVEPDLTVNTMNSSRQDAFTMPTWRIYYGLYLFMALRTGDREFRFVADRMLEQSLSRVSWAGLKASDDFAPDFEYLPFALMDKTLQNEWSKEETSEPDFNYTKFFRDSGVLRHKKDSFSLTLIKNNPTFALLKYGRHNVFLRLCGTFYAQGQFQAEELIETERGYHMSYRRRWGYKSPLPERQETSDWRKMDHSRRSDVMMQDFVFHVDVEIIENGARIRIKTEGVECVLVKFEILLDPGAIYTAGGVTLTARAGEYLLQSERQSKYTYPDGCALVLRGGTVQHGYADRMRGSICRDEARFTVASTYETPMEDEFVLRFED